MSATTPAGRLSDENPGVQIDELRWGNDEEQDRLQVRACPAKNLQDLCPQESTKYAAVSKQMVKRSGGTNTSPKINGKQPSSATGFRSILEWECAGISVEWVSAKDAPVGLMRVERETSVAYLETDTLADIMTCNVLWMRRIESMGVGPTKIVAFERGNGQIRHYQIPKHWVRRPYPSVNQPGRYRSAEEWKSEGVLVQYSTGDFPKSERETSLSFIATEPLMEINTCNKSWHRRLEQAGAKPESIQVHEGAAAEFRWYLTPRRWSKLPAKSGKK